MPIGKMKSGSCLSPSLLAFLPASLLPPIHAAQFIVHTKGRKVVSLQNAMDHRSWLTIEADSLSGKVERFMLRTSC